MLLVYLVVVLGCLTNVGEAFTGRYRSISTFARSGSKEVLSSLDASGKRTCSSRSGCSSSLFMARAGSFGVKDKGEVFFCSECGTEHINWYVKSIRDEGSLALCRTGLYVCTQEAAHPPKAD